MQTQRIIGVVLLILGILLSIIGALFKVLHWPDLFQGMVSGPVAMIFGGILAFWGKADRNKKKPS